LGVQVQDIFHEIADLSSEERERYFAVRKINDDLRKEAEALVAFDSETNSALVREIAELADGAVASFQHKDTMYGGLAEAGASAIEADTVIGDYRLVQRIGAGGMGEVWLVEQSKPVRRLVALKIIRAGMDTREFITRFESERQALALMNHPAVAKVFDGGSTSTGTPYFVMEYVSGAPITDWCDTHKLTLTERLKLFIQACEGVNHAHQKAIIHRDLKPSNILITETDGKAVPKIIDFGVAKAISQKLSEETLQTRPGVILGTLDYMSPEQASSMGEDLDTRTDVYSLGIILYHLLVGAAPIELGQGPLEEKLRKLREEDPPRPSARLREQWELSATICGNRNTQPRMLVRQLRGDLDFIALKALEKERSRRYGSPAELASDIERYLHHEPVLAQPPSSRYRAGKYFRRHRIGVTFATAVVLLLAIFGIIQTLELRRITRERSRADRVTGFMTEMFQIADPSESRGNRITAREILDKASDRIRTSLVQDPELRAQMMQAMSTVYLNLGLYSRAESLAQQSFQIRRVVLGPNEPDTLHSGVDVGIALLQQGQFAQAEKWLRSSAESLGRLRGSEHPDTLRASVNLGADLSDQGRAVEAEMLLKPTLASLRRVVGPENIDVVKCMDDLAWAFREQHRYAEQEKMEREALGIAKRTLGPDHPVTLHVMLRLATALDDEGRYVEEEPLVRQSIQAEQRVLGPESAETLASMNNLATILMHNGQYSEAELQFRSVRDIQRRTLGRDHPQTAVSTYNLACIATYRGDYPAALLLLREALDHGLRPPDAAGIKDDPDLKPLHSDPHFADLVAYAQRRK
jgi:serine/threonine protein kinase